LAEVYYYIGHVKTRFDEWLGCATKYCAAHKKNKQVCYIRPETTVYPRGNGLYECEDCHKQLSSSRQGDFWTVRDLMPNLFYDVSMSEQEAAQLRYHLAALKHETIATTNE
jgi:hypothetical protein